MINVILSGEKSAPQIYGIQVILYEEWTKFSPTKYMLVIRNHGEVNKYLRRQKQVPRKNHIRFYISGEKLSSAASVYGLYNNMFDTFNLYVYQNPRVITKQHT